MTKIRKLESVFILAGIFLVCSCSPKQVRTVQIAFDNACTLEQQKIAYEVINKRVAIWGVKEKTDLTDGKFDLSYVVGKQHNSNSDTLLVQILTERGEIYITEIYQQNEIQSPRDSVYERLFSLVENAEHYPKWRMDGLQTNTPDLIKVPFEQVLYIDSVFNSFQHLFPAGISLAWTAKPDREDFFALLPLKTLHKLPLNPNTVKKSNIQNYDGHQELFIELHKEYAEEWARMTRHNIDRNLAIVMDGKVLMYPRVNLEIVGGKLVITGDFDNNEFALMKSVILGGVLECKAQIINQETK